VVERSLAIAAAAGVVSVVGIACGSRPETPRPLAEDFVEVDYPPPPAQVEEMTEKLAGRPECSWQDGYHEWSGRRYRWMPGEWVVVPADCVYAPPAVTWVQGNPARLYYTPPRWYRAGSTGSARPVACAAPTPCLSPPPPR
jgi:hypothetical protein